MHLGKLPSSLPESLPIADLGPRTAWSRVVQVAIDNQVHCVALAGDLVDRDNALFEAYGLLDQGIRELTDQGIQVCAVAGNHDTETLPDLANQIEGFHLLGPRGTWSVFEVPGQATRAVRLLGWSFPSRHHRASPLETAPPMADPAFITLGLLHADLDAGSSAYAPVSSRELQNHNYQGWFLGHVHLPDPVPTDGSPFYLGSVSALTPNERGLHGPVLVTISDEGKIVRHRLPLAPLRWEELTIDCTGLVNPGQTLKSHLLAAVRDLSAQLEDELDQVRALGLRLVLTGQIDQPVELTRVLAVLDSDELQIPGSSRITFVRKITNRVVGTFDLPALADQDHPAGILARQILILQRDPKPVNGVVDARAARTELIRLARLELTAVDARDAFTALQQSQETDSLTDEDLAAVLLDVSRQALADLLAGKEGDHAAF